MMMIMGVVHLLEPSGDAAITVCDELSNMINTPANVNRKLQLLQLGRRRDVPSAAVLEITYA
jgi:hypothetical protein